MATIRTAFLSSTGADLTAHREAARAAIDQLSGWKCVRMEDFPASKRDIASYCQARVRECDLFIGIVGLRFGTGPAGSKASYTQLEFEAAGEDRLIFMAPDDFPVAGSLREPNSKNKAQMAFRKRLKSGDTLPARPFESADKLALQIVQAIREWERRPPPPEDPAGYLEFLHKDTSQIGIGGFQTGQRETYRFAITELYTPLTTVLVPEEGRQRKEQKEQKAVPLVEALEKKRIVLVGDPGAGKTTFLRRIAFAVCETLLGNDPGAFAEFLKVPECPFPLLVSAGSLAEFIEKSRKVAGFPIDLDSPDWIPRYLAASSVERGWGLGAEFFRTKLAGGGGGAADGGRAGRGSGRGGAQVPGSAAGGGGARLCAGPDCADEPASGVWGRDGDRVVYDGDDRAVRRRRDCDVPRQLVPAPVQGRRRSGGDAGGGAEQAGDSGTGGESGDADGPGGGAFERQAAAGSAGGPL